MKGFSALLVLGLAFTTGSACSTSGPHKPSGSPASDVSANSDASAPAKDAGTPETPPLTGHEARRLAELKERIAAGVTHDPKWSIKTRLEPVVPGEMPKSVEVKVGPVKALDSSSLLPDAVAKRIRGKYSAGLRRCYWKGLKGNHDLKGRSNISFTVGLTGRSTEGLAKGFDEVVDHCIMELVAKWRFHVPKDAAGKPTTSRFKLPLLFKPRAHFTTVDSIGGRQ